MPCCPLHDAVILGSVGQRRRRRTTDKHLNMQGLRRRFATFWPPTFSRHGAPTVEDPQQQHDLPTTTTVAPRNARRSTCRLPAPAVPHTPATNVKGHGGGDKGCRAVAADDKEDYCDGESESTKAVRVLELVHPWGSSHESPPANWSSRHCSPTTKTFTPTRTRGRRRGRDGDVFRNKTTAGTLQPTTTLTTHVSPSSLVEDWGVEQRRLSAKRQRGVGGGGNEYLTVTFSAGDRAKFEQPTNGGVGDQQRCNANPYRHWRPCPADSTFVSPMKRSARLAPEDTHPSNGIATEEDVKLLETKADAEDDNEEAYHARLFPPSHLIFRSGFFKVLAHRRRRKEVTKTAANKGKRGLSSTRFKRRTREIHALIVTHALNAAHPSRDAAEVEGGDASAMVEAAVAAAAARRSRIEEDAVWERVERNELEEEEEAERRAEARRGRLEML